MIKAIVALYEEIESYTLVVTIIFWLLFAYVTMQDAKATEALMLLAVDTLLSAALAPIFDPLIKLAISLEDGLRGLLG